MTWLQFLAALGAGLAGLLSLFEIVAMVRHSGDPATSWRNERLAIGWLIVTALFILVAK